MKPLTILLLMLTMSAFAQSWTVETDNKFKSKQDTNVNLSQWSQVGTNEFFDRGDSSVVTNGSVYLNYQAATFDCFVGNAGNTNGGHYNTGIGYGALQNVFYTMGFNGIDNVAVGFYSQRYTTNGIYNTAVGTYSLANNTCGSKNTAFGWGALPYNTTGSNNIAIGYDAGYNVTTTSSNIDIGNLGVVSDFAITRIGDVQTDTYIAGIIHGNGSSLTNLNYGNFTNQPAFQPASLNLTNLSNGNGSGLTNMPVYQPVSANLTNWSNVATNQYVTKSGDSATNETFYGDANATNWTGTSVSGWLNTNTAGGYTIIQNGNVTSSGTNTSGYFNGNGGGLTNLPSSGGTLTNDYSFTTASNPTNQFATGTLYTNSTGYRAFLVGNVVLMAYNVNGYAIVTLNYTNAGVGFVSSWETGQHSGASSSITNQFSFNIPLCTNATFQFTASTAASCTAWITNTVLWAAP